MNINKEQISILDHTIHRAAGGLYCGDSLDMQALVAAGLMTSDQNGVHARRASRRDMARQGGR